MRWPIGCAGIHRCEALGEMKIRTRPFDMASYLGSEEEVAEYLRQVLEDGC